MSFLPLVLSNGDGTFHGWSASFGTDTTFLAAMTQPGITTVTGDYNADGRSHIALIGNGRILLAFSQGNGTFVVPTCSLAGDPLPIGPLPVAGDFDGDGKSDIQLPGWGFLTFASSGTTCAVNEVHIQQDVTADASTFWSNSRLAGVTTLSFR